MSSAQALLGAVAGRFSVSRSEGQRRHLALAPPSEVRPVGDTIQTLIQQLRAANRSVGGLTKACWAEGKRGLD